MAWITYEPDRIVHLPSNSQITMRSYKIAWNDDKDEHGMVIDHKYGDKVYNWENENDRLRLIKENTDYPWWCSDDSEKEYGEDYYVEEYEAYLSELDELDEEEKEKFVRQRNEEKEKSASRYLVLVGQSQDVKTRERINRLRKRFNPRYSWDGWLQFDNLTICFAITFSDGRSDGKRKLLFISTDRQAFEVAKRGLQLGLGAVRLDELELKGNPSGCKGQIYNAVWDDVLI